MGLFDSNKKDRKDQDGLDAFERMADAASAAASDVKARKCDGRTEEFEGVADDLNRMADEIAERNKNVKRSRGKRWF